MDNMLSKHDLEFHLVGDYYLPNLIPPQETNVGLWGELHRKHLKKHHEGLYTGLLISGKLSNYLAEINTRAEQMMETIINQMKASEKITEELKICDPIEWIRRMSNIQSRAREVVLNDLIYA